MIKLYKYVYCITLTHTLRPILLRYTKSKNYCHLCSCNHCLSFIISLTNIHPIPSKFHPNHPKTTKLKPLSTKRAAHNNKQHKASFHGSEGPLQEATNRHKSCTREINIIHRIYHRQQGHKNKIWELLEGEWRQGTHFLSQNMGWVEIFDHSNVAHIFYVGKLLGIPQRHG